MLCLSETAFESFHRLRREGDFGNEDDRCAPAIKRCPDGLQIDFSLAGTGDAVEQNRACALGRVERLHDLV